MRLTSAILVSALLRRVQSAGGFAAILDRGAEAAGAIFLLERHRDGSLSLAAPAPQALGRGGNDDVYDGERLFERRFAHADSEAVEALMARERRFDPDLWLVEIEGVALDDLVTIIDPDRTN